MIAHWPQADRARQDPESEARYCAISGSARWPARDSQPPEPAPKNEINFAFRCDEATAALLRPMAGYFEPMAKARATDWGPKVTAPETSANTALASGELFVDLAGLIDVDAEIARHEKERERPDRSNRGQGKETL